MPAAFPSIISPAGCYFHHPYKSILRSVQHEQQQTHHTGFLPDERSHHNSQFWHCHTSKVEYVMLISSQKIKQNCAQHTEADLIVEICPSTDMCLITTVEETSCRISAATRNTECFNSRVNYLFSSVPQSPDALYCKENATVRKCCSAKLPHFQTTALQTISSPTWTTMTPTGIN